MQKIFGNKDKKIYGDFLLNIIAVSLFMVIPQMVVFPYLGSSLTASEYGTILTITAIANVLGAALGNALNTTRILMQAEYEKKQKKGDFNLIFIAAALCNALIVAAIMTLMFSRSSADIVSCIIISFLFLFRAYYSAAFRIVINYKKILVTSIFGVCGYLIGFYITTLTKAWYYPFLLGEGFACIYVLFSSNIVGDDLKFTELLNKTLGKFGFLLLATLLTSLMTYMDRFLIYPVLGAEYVAVFNVATFLGRIMGLVLIPVSGVLLTYYAKGDHLSIGDFYKRLGEAAFLNIVFLGVVYLLGESVLRFFYPTITNSAMDYFYIANLAVLINIFSNIINPILLKFLGSRWQVIIHGVYMALYIVSGYVGMTVNGLMGFCVGILIVNCVKVLFMMVLSHKVVSRNASGFEKDT